MLLITPHYLWAALCKTPEFVINWGLLRLEICEKILWWVCRSATNFEDVGSDSCHKNKNQPTARYHLNHSDSSFGSEELLRLLHRLRSRLRVKCPSGFDSGQNVPATAALASDISNVISHENITFSENWDMKMGYVRKCMRLLVPLTPMGIIPSFFDIFHSNHVSIPYRPPPPKKI